MNPGCAELRITTVDRVEYRAAVPLPVLGALTPEELRLAIDARLSRGLPVTLWTTGGWPFRVPPAGVLADLQAASCGTDGP